MPYLDSASYELPFQSGSDTSRAAAVAMRETASTQRERYYQWLADRVQGGTDGEAEVELAMRRSSVCARRNELMKAGRVLKTDWRRVGCAVWRVR